jgi:ABC-2 type transport system ATP-binding protein
MNRVATESLVELKNLHKRYGQLVAVDDVSFQVSRGEVLGFLGPNGAGKSTTMKIVTGFLAPDAGQVTVCGYDLTRYPLSVKQNIGYLPEGAPAYPDMTPAGFLDFVAEIRGLRGGEKGNRIADVVAKVNLGQVLHQPIETLSKGFKRRVGLAQAILHDPQVLVLDEPTDGLDPNQKHEVRTLIKAMASTKAIILSSHILEEVDAVCTRAIIIAGGKVVADGTPSELEARSEEHHAVVLTVRGATSDISDPLRRLLGVRNVKKMHDDNGLQRVHIYPKSTQSILAAVGQAAGENRWRVEELYMEKGRLDDVFRAITTKHQAIS